MGKSSGVIFVFGSNLAGRHGKGSALAARLYHGAVYGVGTGPTGNAYAIPTKDERLRVMPLEKIAQYVSDFIDYAKAHPELDFRCVAIGTGAAGYTDAQMAPLFRDAPSNVVLPFIWRVLCA